MKKLFTNDKFFGAVTILAIVGMILCDSLLFVCEPTANLTLIMDIICVICILFLYTSYRKHRKNMMKCIIGSLLTLVILRPINTLTSGYVIGYPVSTVIMYCYTFAAIILFIDHLLINSDHHSNAGLIRTNQIFCVIIFICEIISTVSALTTIDNTLMKVGYWIGAISFACVTASIVCVESRLDAYRLDREAAGWTEEAGYPEGYVHEYEKK